MARNERILRQWNMLKILQTRGEGMTLYDVAQEFDVSERTIQRDFNALKELGFPVNFEAEDNGRRFWRMPHDFFKTGPLVMHFTEAISLHLAEKMFAPLAGTHLADGLNSIVEKIRKIVPTPALNHFAKLDEIVNVRRIGMTDYSAHTDTIRILTESTQSRTSVKIDYHSLWAKNRYSTLFDPYGLVLFEDDLFTVGKSHRANDTRVLKVARISTLSATNRPFKRPANFNLNDHFRSSFGIIQSNTKEIKVVARFAGQVASLVEERTWHPSQQLHWLDSEATLFDETDEKSSALQATFRLSNLIEFKQWIKAFGQQAEVLRPKWLRYEIRDEFLQAAKQYTD